MYDLELAKRMKSAPNESLVHFQLISNNHTRSKLNLSSPQATLSKL